MSDEQFRASIRNTLISSYPKFPALKLIWVFLISRRYQFPGELLFEGSLFKVGKQSLLLRLFLYKFNIRGFTNPSPLFSSSFYELSNPDVSKTAVKSWVHFAAHGLIEGRAPHPLLDLNFLRNQFSSLSYSDSLRTYLEDSNYWNYQPSPFVDYEKFLEVRGPSRGVHPLKLMLSEGLNSSWISPRLAAIQVDSPPSALEEKLVMTRALFLNNEISDWGSDFHVYERETSNSPGNLGDFLRVSVGHFIAGNEKFIRLSNLVFSQDNKAVVSENFVITNSLLKTTSCTNVVILLNEADASSYEKLIHKLSPGTLILPSSKLQEQSLEFHLLSLGRTDLSVAEFGSQISIVYSEEIEMFSFTDENSRISEKLQHHPLHCFRGEAVLLIDNSEITEDFYKKTLRVHKEFFCQIYVISPNLPMSFILGIKESRFIFYTQRAERFARSICPENSLISVRELKEEVTTVGIEN